MRGLLVGMMILMLAGCVGAPATPSGTVVGDAAANPLRSSNSTKDLAGSYVVGAGREAATFSGCEGLSTAVPPPGSSTAWGLALPASTTRLTLDLASPSPSAALAAFRLCVLGLPPKTLSVVGKPPLRLDVPLNLTADRTASIVVLPSNQDPSVEAAIDFQLHAAWSHAG